MVNLIYIRRRPENGLIVNPNPEFSPINTLPIEILAVDGVGRVPRGSGEGPGEGEGEREGVSGAGPVGIFVLGIGGGGGGGGGGSGEGVFSAAGDAGAEGAVDGSHHAAASEAATAAVASEWSPHLSPSLSLALCAMATGKPRILIIGAGMAGLTAAHKLHTSSDGAFEVHVAEGGDRIGGRINTSEFCGDRVELGATWIHGINGSPVYGLARKLDALKSSQPWECMDSAFGGPVTVSENGYEINSELVKSVSKCFDVLMDFAQGKGIGENGVNYHKLAEKCCQNCEKNGDFNILTDFPLGRKFEKNGINYCQMAEKGYEICEKSGDFDILMDFDKGRKIEKEGINYCEMAENGCQNYLKNEDLDLVMDFDKGAEIEENGINYWKIAEKAYEICMKHGDCRTVSIGGYLRKGLELYWGLIGEKEELKGFGDWDKKSILESVFEMKENTQRTYTSADELATLDFEAEHEYKMFSGEEITIAKGYMRIIESLALALPRGCVQLGKKVNKIEWRSEDRGGWESEFAGEVKAVKVNFLDGSYMFADHVIVTVSLGVLKAGVSENWCQNSGMFDPPLPSFKVDAISRVGYGVVNKLFLELSPSGLESGNGSKFPFLQMAFHKSDSEFRDPKVPWWMRRSNSLCPIYGNSNVVLCWFAGKEALELESLEDEEIIDGVSNTLSRFSIKSKHQASSSFGKVLKTRWGNDPLFLGSYSYVAVGSSGDDLDTMAVPLPENGKNGNSSCFPLQILFAGEATHRTHYSTTHGAYFSGLREANRLLQHYGL